MLYFHLNLGIDDPITVNHSKYKQVYRSTIDLSDITPLLYDLLEQEGLKIVRGEAYYWKPNFFMPVHTDNNDPDQTRMNWVFGGAGSQMHWYKLKDSIVDDVIMGTDGLENDSVYKIYDKDTVERIESVVITNPTLVQVGVPHNVTTGNEDRLCFSLKLAKINSGKKGMPFSEAVSILQKYAI